MFESFLCDEFECLILIFFLLLRSKTEQILDVRFFRADNSLVGRNYMDSTTVCLDQKAVEFVVSNTFESQVEELKAESLQILNK